MTVNNERLIDEHIINPKTDLLRLVACGKRGYGNANHHYLITGMDYGGNRPLSVHAFDSHGTHIIFQNGTIQECGANGLTDEVLLAIVVDRLRGFQDGPFRCRENACTLTHIEEALHWLHQRTISRMRRGVEGSYTQ